MRTDTFEHLQGLCAGKGIVCERRGKKIDMTTPNGGTTAECDSVAEAFDTLRGDPTFSELPLRLGKPAAIVASEVYVYSFWSQAERIKQVEAECLDEAVCRFGDGYEIESWFKGMATIKNKNIGLFFGVTWKEKKPELESVKIGMRKAARIAGEVGDGVGPCSYAHDAIIEAAEKLTEKDLSC